MAIHKTKPVDPKRAAQPRQWYRITGGSHSRHEEGGVKRYETGEYIQMTAEEARAHAYHVVRELPPSAPQRSEQSGSVTGTNWSDLLSLSGAAVIERLVDITDLVQLSEIEAAESSGRKRTAVLRAIAQQITAAAGLPENSSSLSSGE